MTIVALALVLTPTEPAAYRRAMAMIGAAKSLRIEVHTTEMDGSKFTTRYVFQKPNRWRVSTGGNLDSLCDGTTSWQRDGKTWSKSPAPKSIPDDLIPIGFNRFVDPEAPFHERLGPMPWTQNGKKIQAYWLKTTEAGSYAGYIIVDMKTYMPIGHHYSEMGAPGPRIEEYRVVQLNPKLTPEDFRL